MDIKFIRANTDIVKNNLAVRFKDPTLISHDMHFSLFYIHYIKIEQACLLS